LIGRLANWQLVAIAAHARYATKVSAHMDNCVAPLFRLLSLRSPVFAKQTGTRVALWRSMTLAVPLRVRAAGAAEDFGLIVTT
jgi:hypothetical protein